MHVGNLGSVPRTRLRTTRLGDCKFSDLEEKSSKIIPKDFLKIYFFCSIGHAEKRLVNIIFYITSSVKQVNFRC